MRWLAALLLVACAAPGATEVAPGREAVTAMALGPADVLAGAEAAAAAGGVAEAMAAGVAAVLPDGLVPAETALFKRRDAGGAVWSASPLNAADWSGASWGGGTVVTMITDRHGIVSAHVPRAVGSEVRFYTRGGWPVTRTVAAKAVLAPVDGVNLDIAVARLDAPVPSGVAVYPLAAIDADVFAAMAGEGAPVVATHAGRRATVSTLYRGTDDGLRLLLEAGSRRLGLAEDVAHAAQWGDSGHPVFAVTADGPALLSHFHTSGLGGAGPNYADARVRAAVMDAVAGLDD